MDASGAGRRNRSSPSCLNRSAQRIDFFHGLLGSIRKFVSGSSERGSDTAVFHVTSRGGLRVDPGTLFKNSKVLETVDKAAKSESPQMRVGSGGASSMPPQQRNSIEINAPGEWKP